MHHNPYIRDKFQSNEKESDDALYGGFQNVNAQNDIITSTVAAAAQGQRVGFTGDFGGNNFGTGTTNLRPPTQFNNGAQQGNGERPRTSMNSVRGAGYRGKTGTTGGRTSFDPFQQAAQGPPPPLVQNTENGPEYKAKVMERQVNALMEESATASVQGKKALALSKAKEAVQHERKLFRHREKHDHGDQNNLELCCAVLFNLAHQYHINGKKSEALQTYGSIVNRKEFPLAGRLRVNMGNIFFEQKKYPAANKMYKMAIDQIGQQSASTRYAIMRNIGISLVQMRQFPEAIISFDAIMKNHPDPQTGFNLILCYYALGDKEKMKMAFKDLLTVPQYGEDEENEEEETKVEDSHLREDELKKDRIARKKKLNRYVFQAAKLLAPVIEDDLGSGYDWVIEFLKAPRLPSSPGRGTSSKNGFAKVAMEMEISKGIAYLKRKNIAAAIEVFKSFETKDEGLIDQAATNLSFLFFLEGDYKNAAKYAELAVKTVRYDARAHVNKANYLVQRGELEKAKDLYLEAIGVEEDCVVAIYNLGLIEKRLGNLDDALEAFKQLHRMVPEDAQVIYQIANLYDLLNDNKQAAEWFKILHVAIPTDPKVLARLASLYNHENDDVQAFHHYMDSYTVYPVNMEVIAWLGVWYVKTKNYVEAFQFFQRAAEIDPGDVKWQLMVASCHRRMDNLSHALDLYKKIHKQDPDNIECLRYLVAICKEMNDSAYEGYCKLLRQREREEEEGRSAYMQGEEQGQYANQLPNNGPTGGGVVGETPVSSPNGGGRSLNSPSLKTPSKNLNQSFDNSAPANSWARGTQMLASSNAAAKDDDDDDWGDDDDMDDMLPGL